MATLVALPASLVPRVHTALSVAAFSTALALGYAAGLWEVLCENAVAKWPVEWFPSVSATIGDHAAPRAPFQILIALTAAPRLILLGLQWIAHRYPPVTGGSAVVDKSSGASSARVSDGVRSRKTRSSNGAIDAAAAEVGNVPAGPLVRTGWVDAEIFAGIGRTFCCGGWMYITSRDQHDLHDLFMIVYLVLNIPWMFLSTMHSTNERVRTWRFATASGFMISIVPLIYLFYKHAVLRVPGAYSYYAIFEWSLVMWDVAFDAGAIFELNHLQVRIIDTTRGGAAATSEAVSEKNGSNGLFVMPAHAPPPLVEEDWTCKPSPPSDMPYRNVVAYVSDLWFAVAFWSVFTSLFVQLFYWSVWSLSFTGSELGVLLNALAFYWYGRPQYRIYALSRNGLFTHRALLYLVGLGCWALPSVGARYICVLIAAWGGWQAFAADMFRMNGSPEMAAQAKIMMTGLVATLVAKYNSHSNNPFWPILDHNSGGWNKTGLFLSVLALTEYYYRPNSLFPAPPVQATLKDKPVTIATTKAQRIGIALGIGGFIHLLQMFVTDAGTILAWTWSGFPVTGPQLHPWSGVVIAVAAAGLAIDIDMFNPIIRAIPLPAAYFLLTHPDWKGFYGGLVLVFYLVTFAPTFFRIASAVPSKTWAWGCAWCAFLQVADVFTVAYAFVPFGWILRERTDLVLMICLLPLPSFLVLSQGLKLPDASALTQRSKVRTQSIIRWTRIAAAVLALAGLGSGYERMQHTAEVVRPTPYYPDHNIFSGGIFTVHFGIDEPGRDSQRRIAQLIDEMQVDVLGMLETDLHRFVYGNRDLTRYIAEELGYYVDLGPGPNKHTWGACLLSKYPIINSTHHLLPSPHGELAPAIHATLDIRGQRVDVLVAHNGQEEDALDRELQTKELARLLTTTGDTPTVFLGYLVTKLKQAAPWPYGLLFTDVTGSGSPSGLYDIEHLDTWRWCEYIGFRNLWRIAFSRLEHSDVTDTELQVGKFILPLPGTKVKYETDGDLYWHIGETDVPEPWRMPTMFRGEGQRGHKYRIWDGPLYYQPPPSSGVRGYGWGNSTEWPPKVEA